MKIGYHVVGGGEVIAGNPAEQPAAVVGEKGVPVPAEVEFRVFASGVHLVDGDQLAMAWKFAKEGPDRVLFFEDQNLPAGLFEMVAQLKPGGARSYD